MTSNRGARAAVIALLLVCAGACESENSHGKCVGLNGHESPKLAYEYSATNIFWGVVGVELIYPPIKVALDELKCPTGPADSASSRQEEGR